MTRSFTLVLLFLSFFLCSGWVKGQQPIAWQQNLGTPYSDYGLQIFPDQAGNLVLIGQEPHADFAGNIKTYLVTAKYSGRTRNLEDLP